MYALLKQTVNHVKKSILKHRRVKTKSTMMYIESREEIVCWQMLEAQRLATGNEVADRLVVSHILSTRNNTQ